MQDENMRQNDNCQGTILMTVFSEDGQKKIKYKNNKCKNPDCCNHYSLNLMDDNSLKEYIVEDKNYPADLFVMDLPYNGKVTSMHLSEKGKSEFQLK